MTDHPCVSPQGTIVFSAPGDVLSTNANELRREAEALIASEDARDTGWSVLLIDLSRAQAIDSVGLNFLVYLLKETERRGKSLRIRVDNANVQRVLRFTRLDQRAEVVSC